MEQDQERDCHQRIPGRLLVTVLEQLGVIIKLNRCAGGVRVDPPHLIDEDSFGSPGSKCRFLGYTMSRYLPVTPTKRSCKAGGKSATRKGALLSWVRRAWKVSRTSSNRPVGTRPACARSRPPGWRRPRSISLRNASMASRMEFKRGPDRGLLSAPRPAPRRDSPEREKRRAQFLPVDRACGRARKRTEPAPA